MITLPDCANCTEKRIARGTGPCNNWLRLVALHVVDELPEKAVDKLTVLALAMKMVKAIEASGGP